MSIRHFNQGFTLIELVVTVAIVALLASIAIPMAELVVQRNHEHELRLALREIRTALDAYKQAVEEGRITQKLDQSGYPESLDVLVDGVADASNPNAQKKLYFLRRIPRDPFSNDQTQSDAQTWGLRSYASSHDEPQVGEDVFDVYSLAPGKGLNGIPYHNW